MGAAGNIEMQPIRAVERDQRRIAVAPVGKRVQEGGIGKRIGRQHLQIGMHGAGLGNALAAGKLQAFGVAIERDNAHGIVLLGGKDDRRMVRTPA